LRKSRKTVGGFELLKEVALKSRAIKKRATWQQQQTKDGNHTMDSISQLFVRVNMIINNIPTQRSHQG